MPKSLEQLRRDADKEEQLAARAKAQELGNLFNQYAATVVEADESSANYWLKHGLTAGGDLLKLIAEDPTSQEADVRVNHGLREMTRFQDLLSQPVKHGDGRTYYQFMMDMMQPHNPGMTREELGQAFDSYLKTVCDYYELPLDLEKLHQPPTVRREAAQEQQEATQEQRETVQEKQETVEEKKQPAAVLQPLLDKVLIKLEGQDEPFLKDWVSGLSGALHEASTQENTQDAISALKKKTRFLGRETPDGRTNYDRILDELNEEEKSQFFTQLSELNDAYGLNIRVAGFERAQEASKVEQPQVEEPAGRESRLKSAMPELDREKFNAAEFGNMLQTAQDGLYADGRTTLPAEVQWLIGLTGRMESVEPGRESRLPNQLAQRSKFLNEKTNGISNYDLLLEKLPPEDVPKFNDYMRYLNTTFNLNLDHPYLSAQQEEPEVHFPEDVKEETEEALAEEKREEEKPVEEKTEEEKPAEEKQEEEKPVEEKQAEEKQEEEKPAEEKQEEEKAEEKDNAENVQEQDQKDDKERRDLEEELNQEPANAVQDEFFEAVRDVIEKNEKGPEIRQDGGNELTDEEEMAKLKAEVDKELNDEEKKLNKALEETEAEVYAEEEKQGKEQRKEEEKQGEEKEEGVFPWNEILDGYTDSVPRQISDSREKLEDRLWKITLIERTKDLKGKASNKDLDELDQTPQTLAFKEEVAGLSMEELKSLCGKDQKARESFQVGLASKEKDIEAYTVPPEKLDRFIRTMEQVDSSLESTGTGTFLGIKRRKNSPEYGDARSSIQALIAKAKEAKQKNLPLEGLEVYQQMKNVTHYLADKDELRSAPSGQVRWNSFMKACKAAMPEKTFTEQVYAVNRKRPVKDHVSLEDFQPDLTARELITEAQQRIRTGKQDYSRDIAVIAAAYRLSSPDGKDFNKSDMDKTISNDALRQEIGKVIEDPDFYKVLHGDLEDKGYMVQNAMGKEPVKVAEYKNRAREAEAREKAAREKAAREAEARKKEAREKELAAKKEAVKKEVDAKVQQLKKDIKQRDMDRKGKHQERKDRISDLEGKKKVQKKEGPKKSGPKKEDPKKKSPEKNGPNGGGFELNG